MFYTDTSPSGPSSSGRASEAMCRTTGDPSGALLRWTDPSDRSGSSPKVTELHKKLNPIDTVSLEEFGAFSVSASLSEEETQTTAQVLLSGLRQLQRLERLAATTRRANEERMLQRETAPISIITASSAMKALLEISRKVAIHDTSVFLRGESGTGKELLARYIHQHSRRAHRPFIAVNCGALPANLIESALFGHERGAFTGASERHRGVFERAEGGTLFLDELAELPVSLQSKLLRVLQEREIERIGSEQVLQVNVRVIAATHKNVEELVAHGGLRADLYYRLHAFPLVLPPLRERPEDILPLAKFLLQKISEKLNRLGASLSTEQEGELRAYQWPGNVRELENFLERAVILSSDEQLSLPPLASGANSPTKETAAVETFARATRRILQQALAATDGKIYGPDGAAALLGLNPSTLQGKLKKAKLRYGETHSRRSASKNK